MRHSIALMLTLFKYFNRTKAEGSSLPDPSGPLSEKVPATVLQSKRQTRKLMRLGTVMWKTAS